MFKAGVYALQGIKELMSHRAFRHESYLFLFWSSLLVYYQDRNLLPIMGLCGLLLAVEALNSAIETLCDHVTPEHHKTIKIIKDMAAAPSLILIIIIAIYIWFYVDNLLRVHRDSISSSLRAYVDFFSHNSDAFYIAYAMVLALSILASLAIIRKKTITAIVLLVLLKLWVIDFISLRNLVSSYGQESIDIAFNFKFADMAFFFSTVNFSLFATLFDRTHPLNSLLMNILFIAHFLLILAIFYGLSKINFFRINFFRPIFWASLVTMIISLVFLLLPIEVFIYRHFTAPKPTGVSPPTVPPPHSNKTLAKNNRLSLVVYMGESTSRMNMQLYGYFRDTTPKLQAIKNSSKNLLVFNHVFSTFTHTNESLSEALTIGTKANEDNRTITEKNRISTPYLLSNWAIEAQLYSTQCKDRACDTINRQIFPSIDKHFAEEAFFQYDSDYLLPRLSQFLGRLNPTSGNHILFLHSYAGHGDYLDYLPASYRGRVDGHLSEQSKSHIYGNSNKIEPQAEFYDSAIKYIDNNLAQAIGSVQSSPAPLVLVYFSDHGESTYTNRGHDSSRYILEIETVPFFLYFNDAAIKHYPELFSKYQHLSQTGNLATLGQLSSTLIDLFGIDPKEIRHSGIQTLPVIGSKLDRIPPVLVRNRLNYYSFIDLNPEPQMLKSDLNGLALVDEADPATQVFRQSVTVKGQNGLVCTDQVNTIGSAVRGLFSSNCIRIKVEFLPDHQLAVKTATGGKTGLNYQQLVVTNRHFQKTEWLEVDNFSVSANCLDLQKYLSTNRPIGQKLIVDFPASTAIESLSTRDCIQQLGKATVQPSYHLDDSLALNCSATIASPESVLRNGNCLALNQQLQSLQASKVFSEISFDYKGLNGVKQLPFAHYFKWNISNVPPSEIATVRRLPIHAMAVATGDPNLYQ